MKVSCSRPTCSVVDEVTELGWPVLWCVLLGVVPPFLGVPSVELDHGGCLPPGEGLASSDTDDVEEPPSEVSANFAASLGAANNGCEESPEAEDPGGWDEPGDDSVVDLLHNAVVDVGEEPEEGGESEEDSAGDRHDVPEVFGSLGPGASNADLGSPDGFADLSWVDGGSEDRWPDGEPEPDEADSDGGCSVVLVEEVGVFAASCGVSKLRGGLLHELDRKSVV